MTDRITIARHVNFPLVASDRLSPADAAADNYDDDADCPGPPTANAEIERNSGPLGLIFQLFAI